MLRVMWSGEPLNAASAEVTYELPNPRRWANIDDPAFPKTRPRVRTQYRVSLADGQRFPAKRGTPVTLRHEEGGYVGEFPCIVRFRRLNRAVLDALFD